MKAFASVLALLAAFTPMTSALAAFPEFADIPDHEKMPPGATVAFGEGAVLVNGKPRFLIGATFFQDAERDAEVRTTGYPQSLSWIYESLPDYADAQRLGLDAFGATPARTWRRRYRPRPVPRRNMNILGRPLNAGVPILAELAIEPGTHAWMTYMEGVNPPEGAWFDGMAHGIPYSVAHVHGTALWKRIWSSDAAYYRQNGVTPFAWRLFAGADFFDTDRRNTTAFTQWLNARWKTPAEFNKGLGASFSSFPVAARAEKNASNLGLTVEYVKFLEDRFALLCTQAVEIVRSATGDPAPGVCFQPLRADGKGIDILQAAANHPILCAPANQTQPRYVALYMQAVAQGRPVFSPPVRPAIDAETTRADILSQFARGYALCYLEKWRRHPREWVKYTRDDGPTRLDEAATEAAGRQHAAENPANFMNPYAVPPEALLGIRLAKQDALKAAELFTLANRTNGAHVALLHSRPSVRLAHARGDPKPLDTLPQYADALVFAQFKTALVLEEQLADQDLSRYAAIVVPDACRASYPETPAALRRYAERGGRLVVAAGALSQNEHGANATNALALASAQNEPRTQPLGGGRVTTLPPGFAATNLVASLGALLDGLDVPRAWRGLDPATGQTLAGIEGTHARAPDGRHGLILFNRTDAPLPALVSITGIASPKATDLRTGSPLPSRDGKVEITLAPNRGEMILITAN
ncbi:MAG: hypothetical protein ACOX9C_00250 [Kiritimatiellia bacterium]|jgi:hypothetical protein